MPSFVNPFEGIIDLDRDKLLTRGETVRALRFAIAAELEAAEVYERISNVTQNFPTVQKGMLNIAREEKVHVGEFLRMLFRVSNSEKQAYKDGYKEAKKKFG